MGIVGRLLRWGCWVGLFMLVLTIGAVMFFSASNLRSHGDGRGLVGSVDAILVLGGGVDGDGVLGFSSRRRVAGAVELLQAGKAGRLIFSGGVDARNPGVSAASLMQDHALALGAPPEALLVEPEAKSTFQNLQFGFALAKQQGIGTVAILSDAFHVERARALAAYFGHPDTAMIAVAGLERDGFANRFWSILREALAWWYNLAKVALHQVQIAAGAAPAPNPQ